MAIDATTDVSHRNCQIVPESILRLLFGSAAEKDASDEADHMPAIPADMDEESRLLLMALGAPGRMGEAYRRLQGFINAGRRPLDLMGKRHLQRLEAFGPRYAEFAEIAMPDLKVGGWTTAIRDINDMEMIFAFRTHGDSWLQVLYIKDFEEFDAVQAMAGFSEVDLHPYHIEGLLESTALVESADAGLWAQLRESTDEIVQVEMVNALDEPLGAIMHMYYSSAEGSVLFPGAHFPPPRRPRRSQNYKQSVCFLPLGKRRVRAHFGFVMDMDPRMQSAIHRLPPDVVATLLSKAFSAWPLGFRAFLQRHRKEIARRERSSVHAPFYALCRAYLEGRAPPNSVLWTQPQADESNEVFFDAEEGNLVEPIEDWQATGPSDSPTGPAQSREEDPTELECCLCLDQEKQWDNFCGGRPPPDIVGLQRRRPSSVGISFNTYARRHTADYQALKALAADDGWDFRMKHDGVDIFTKDVENMPCKCFKGVVDVRTFGHGAKSIGEALKAHGNRLNWDDLCVFSKVVEEYPPFYSVGHYKFSSGTRLISNREMLVMCHLFFEEDGTIYATSKSVLQDDVPEDPECVRATLHAGGYIVRPGVNKDAFQVVVTGCVEGGGWIPTWVQDMVAWRQPLAMAHFRDLFEEAAQVGGEKFAGVRGANPDL